MKLHNDVGTKEKALYVDTNKKNTLQAVLSTAHHKNLYVETMENARGLIRFKPIFLTAAQLDKCCHYPPAVCCRKTKNEVLNTGTFVDWDARSVSGKSGNVIGTVAITILISPNVKYPGNTGVQIRGDWVVSNDEVNLVCRTKQNLEAKFSKDVVQYILLFCNPGSA